MIRRARLPKWMSQVCLCPSCGLPISMYDIMSFGMKLNAQHFGDFYVMAICPRCNAGIDLHYRNACPDVHSFVDFLRKGGQAKAVFAKDIQARENNLTDEIIRKINRKSKGVTTSDSA